MPTSNQQSGDKPSLSEILALVQAIHPPAPSVSVPVSASVKEGTGDLAKYIATGLGTILVALVIWAGSQLAGLSTSMATISANISGLQKSIADLQTTQTASTSQMSDLRASDARQDARAAANEADMNRVKERLRIVEGQKPLTGPLTDR